MSKILRTCLIMLVFLSFGTLVYAQTVTGKVTSEKDGEPVIGASVSVKGTTRGVITDFEGNYSINVQGAKILVVSSIGFETMEIEVGSRTRIDVSLKEDLQQLEAVVVTAYGMKREKKKLGYAVTELKGSELAEVPNVNPVASLQGKVAGVNISGGAGGTFGGNRITIRGNATFDGNTQPLFVIDGVFIDNGVSGGNEWGVTDWGNDLKNLPTEDFESVSVLKGASAAALYGSRAINGVVVITTKKGKSRKGIGVSVSQNNAWRVVDGPDFQNIYGEGTVAGYYPQDNWNSQFSIDAEGDPILEGDSMSWGPKMEGQKVKDYVGEWTTFDPQPDNYKDAYETGFYNNTNVSLSGGGEHSTYRLSYNFVKDNGVEINNNFKMNSLSGRFSHDFGERLKAEMGINYSKSVSENPPSRKLQRAFIYEAFSRNYNTNKWKDRYREIHGGVPQKGENMENVPGAKMWFGLNEINRANTETMFRSDVKLTYKIFDWLRVSGEANIYNMNYEYESKELGDKKNNEGGYYELKLSGKKQMTYRANILMNKDFGSDWTTALNFGAERWENRWVSSRSRTNGGLISPGAYFLGNSKAQAYADGGVSDTKKTNALFLLGELAWKNMLFFDFTGRNDWSSALTYPDGHGNNSYYYGSYNLAWAFSESFELPEFISFAKLRASYAEVGNDTRPYELGSGYKNANLYKGEGGDVPNSTFNSGSIKHPDLKPQRTKSYEFGLNMQLFDSRVDFDLSYYKQKTIDQILNLGVPGATGVGAMQINGGEISNEGIELLVNTRPIVTQDFSWDLDFNWTMNKNEIGDMYPGITEKTLRGNPRGGDNIAAIAYANGNYGDLVTDADFKLFQATDAEGNPVAHKNNGKKVLVYSDEKKGAKYVRRKEISTVGNVMPDWFGGISNTFKYKGFSLRALISVKMGGDIYSFSSRYGQAVGSLKSS
ncbi:MAG: SusC/RagA family TonB-linked outer membrane protein, partial [Cytophagales bacterium]|nr:SusC/RagA family TonB-linked outer membrane protein [Cytophagales bacterium]